MRKAPTMCQLCFFFFLYSLTWILKGKCFLRLEPSCLLEINESCLQSVIEFDDLTVLYLFSIRSLSVDLNLSYARCAVDDVSEQ